MCDLGSCVASPEYVALIRYCFLLCDLTEVSPPPQQVTSNFPGNLRRKLDAFSRQVAVILVRVDGNSDPEYCRWCPSGYAPGARVCAGCPGMCRVCPGMRWVCAGCPGMRRVCAGYAPGMRRVCAGYAPGMRRVPGHAPGARVCAGYAPGARVCAKYALGAPPPVGGLNRVYLEAESRVWCGR